MAQGRFLGDVPGLDDLLPNSAVLPNGYSVTEVNSLGEITADMAGIGDALTGMGTGDPFAYSTGFADREQEGEGEGGEGYVAQYDPMQSSYLPTYDDSGTVYSGVGGFDAEQVENAQIIAATGKRLGASDRDIQIALMAGIVESGLRNLDYGDRDSIGIFQQRDAWGSREARLNPAKAAAMFFLGGSGGQEGLLDIKDRDSRPMGEVAQDVQVSAYPDRYAQHEAEAAQLLGLMGDTTSGKVGKNPYGLTTWDGETVDNMTAAALKAATKEFGSNFSIMQGSHSHDVAASGSTHDGGGVVDLSVPNGDWVGAMTALRKIGFAAWVRNVPGYGSAGSGAHIHAVLIGNERLSPQAQLQVQSYLNNDDGLSGSRPDDGPRQYVNNRFVWGARKQQGPTWRDEVANLAQQFLGTEFRWGGQDFDGVDYEGLVRGIYSKVGLDVPNLADDIARLSDPIDVAEARKGDLIGWNDAGDTRFGIYLGNGRFIEAGGPGRVVQINDLGAAALNAFGIPLEQIINRPAGVNRPAPVTAPPSVSYSGAPPAGSGQGQANAPVEQAPSRGPRNPQPNPQGPLQNTTFDQKPHPF